MADWLAAIILGLVEGLTEFIPVSSTGHLLLTQKLLGLTDPRWTSFIVLIQMGAILAVVALYFARLWKVLIGLPTDPKARHFALSVLIAFLPSVLVGLLLYDFIKLVLFDSVTVICVSLIVGGFGLIILERFAPTPSADDAMSLSWKRSLGVGLFQCLSVIPGVSRSGATIAGGLTLGLDHGRGLDLGHHPERRGDRLGFRRHHRDRFCRVLRERLGRGQGDGRFRRPARLHALRLVADRGRGRGAGSGLGRPGLGRKPRDWTPSGPACVPD